MLHLTTPLFRYELLPLIYKSIPPHSDIVWHISKTSKREKLSYDFLQDSRIKVYESDCSDHDIITKRNLMFDNISSGQFTLVDDDTLFHPNMYEVYLRYKDYDGMIIGTQVNKKEKVHLYAGYPACGTIDSGNVLCHSSVLDKVRWKKGEGLSKKFPKDFIFWDSCFKIFGKERTVLVDDVISINNALR